ncbi:HSP20-like chaperone [Xylariaceae sp. FL0255]|nr:HSP20-like chaperone [Xylariaceae sp. FL0255]
MTSDPTSEQEAATRAKEAAEQAALPYKWTQTLEELEVTISSIPANMKSRDMVVELKRQTLKAGIKGQDPIIEGTFPHPVDTEESTWTLTGDSTKTLSIYLSKVNKEEWWAHIVTSAPKIDVTKIEPEASTFGDLKGDYKQVVGKMMYDQQQKAKGLPTSDEERKQDILKNFMAQHPEMDFSQAKIS